MLVDEPSPLVDHGCKSRLGHFGKISLTSGRKCCERIRDQSLGVPPGLFLAGNLNETKAGLRSDPDIPYAAFIRSPVNTRPQSLFTTVIGSEDHAGARFAVWWV
jgi:hypothetical protein